MLFLERVRTKDMPESAAIGGGATSIVAPSHVVKPAGTSVESQG